MQKTYIQTKPFLFIVQLTGNCIFQPLDFEKLCCHKVSWRHVFAQAGGSQDAKDRKQRKVPQAHYGTNNPSPVWGMVEPTGRLPSQPVDLWQRPEVRLRGEVLPSLRGGNFADAATSHCQKKIPQKKEQFRPNRGKKSLGYLHFLAEDQLLVRLVLLRRGQQEVVGLLLSPLITLNNSNGHTFEIKSTYSHAHMHTGHSHTDLALHSDRLLHWPSSWNGWLLWASFTSSRVGRKHLDYYFL